MVISNTTTHLILFALLVSLDREQRVKVAQTVGNFHQNGNCGEGSLDYAARRSFNLELEKVQSLILNPHLLVMET
jgi:hypothetical protein